MKKVVFNSIKFKINSMLIGFILSLIILTIIVLFASSRILTSYIADKNISIAEELSDKIDIFIYNYINELSDVTYQPNVINVLTDSNNSLENEEVRNIKFNDESNLWNISNSNYNKISSTELSVYLKSIFKDKDIRNHGYLIFGEVFITNKYGAVVATNNKTSKYLQNEEVWWQEAIKRGIYYSDIIYDESSEIYGMQIAVPITVNEETLGVITGILDISKVIEESKIGWDTLNEIDTTLLTQDGKVIHSSKLFKFLADDPINNYIDNSPEVGNGYYIGNDEGILYSYSKSSGYRNYDGLNWTLVISESLDHALEPIYEFSNIIYIILIIIIFVFTILTFYILSTIVRPLEEFVRGVKVISSGNLSYTFKIKQNIELITLSDSFNNMMDKLEASRKKIEEKERRAVILSNKLKASNEDLEQFAYIASHDLKEPLRKITAYGGLLGEEYSDKIDEQGKKYISVMDNASRRMDDLLTNLLAYSRVENRGREFHVFNLEEILNNVLSDLEIQLKESGTTVTYKDLPSVFGDSIQIAQVLQNTIANAIKFVKPGTKLKITISSNFNVKKNINIIKISDNGIGFDIKYQEEIFKPFKKLHSSKVYAGTGIGLAICKKIIKRHNGTINVDSIVGEGTTFYISLPIVKKDDGQNE